MSIFDKVLTAIGMKKAKAATKIPPLKSPTAGSNAQTTAYGKAMQSAQKNTKTFGLPGK